jgi:hypothetical protein
LARNNASNQPGALHVRSAGGRIAAPDGPGSLNFGTARYSTLMAKDRNPDRWGRLTQPPSEVEITVLPGRDGRAHRGRIVEIYGLASAHAVIVLHALIVLVLVFAAIGAIVAGGLLGDHHRSASRSALDLREGGPAGVAAAYGYPLRCLSVTVAANDPTYARADFDRRSLCGRYDGPVTAIFHRVDGAWSTVLDTISYTCPVASLPPAVQATLGVCLQPDRPMPRHQLGSRQR